MDFPTTPQQAEYLQIADRLADRFAARADEQDRSGEFPFANFADIRAAGLPALAVPVEYGGWGATLLDTVRVAEHLARGDGSTALSFVMHLQTIGSAVETGGWPQETLAELCRATVERGALVNSLATEPALGSPSRGGRPQTTAQPIYGADGAITSWILNGCKSFASMFPVLDYAILPAALEDGSGEVGRFLVPVDAHFCVERAWDAVGMRTTGSHTITFRRVVAPAPSMPQQRTRAAVCRLHWASRSLSWRVSSATWGRRRCCCTPRGCNSTRLPSNGCASRPAAPS